MGRAQRILGSFPGFYRAGESGKVLGHVAEAIGGELDLVQREATAVRRAHQLPRAQDEIDLLRLAGTLGIAAADLGILRAYYDAGLFGDHDAGGYGRYLERLREIIARMARLHLDGCGTIWALLEGTSILLAAETLADAAGRPLLEHPDRDIYVDGVHRSGFIHRLAVRFRVPDADPAATEFFPERTAYLYLLENPIEDRRAGAPEARHGERARVDKGGFFDGTAWVEVTGVKGRTVMPMIVNVTTRQGIGFDGVVTAGETLLFTCDGKAFLNGLDVTSRCFAFAGALFDDDEDGFAPATGTLPFVVVEPPGALRRGCSRSTRVPLDRLSMPRLPLGRSDWRFSVREGAFDDDCFNRCVFELPRDPAALAALPPSGKLVIHWREHRAFAATVLLPEDLEQLTPLLGPDVDLRDWIRAGLDRFRGAGIRLAVDYYSEQWILDHSMLRDAEALTGQGVLFDGTVL